jgi:hypothetical protein
LYCIIQEEEIGEICSESPKALAPVDALLTEE